MNGGHYGQRACARRSPVSPVDIFFAAQPCLRERYAAMSLNCTCGLLGNRTLTPSPNGTQLQLLNQSVIDHYGRKTRLLGRTSNHHHDRIWLRGSLVILVVASCVCSAGRLSRLCDSSFLLLTECTWPLIDILRKDLETSLLVRGGPGLIL